VDHLQEKVAALQINEQYGKRAKELWILYRVIEEESKRLYTL